MIGWCGNGGVGMSRFLLILMRLVMYLILLRDVMVMVRVLDCLLWVIGKVIGNGMVIWWMFYRWLVLDIRWIRRFLFLWLRLNGGRLFGNGLRFGVRF